MSRKRIPTDDLVRLTHNPFGSLSTGAAPAAPHPVDADPPRSRRVAQIPARAVVRLERKGRGGKEVTVIEQLGLRPKELATWTQSLKQALGCGGVVEGEAIVLQGDHRDRGCAWLEAQGISKVIRGT